MKSVQKMEIPLSSDFFKVVFQDAFLFGSDHERLLKQSTLSTDEKKLALRIRRADLYNGDTSPFFADVCNQLSDTFYWQSNSEGPWVFCSKIWYFLQSQSKDIAWFKRRVRGEDAADSLRKKHRATVIVQTPQGLLLTRDYKGGLLLPGGEVERQELPISAAARELHEETSLLAQQVAYLFSHESKYYQHHVFVVKQYEGTPSPRSDAKELYFLQPEEVLRCRFPERLSQSNAEILLRYVQQPALVRQVQALEHHRIQEEQE